MAYSLKTDPDTSFLTDHIGSKLLSLPIILFIHLSIHPNIKNAIFEISLTKFKGWPFQVLYITGQIT